MGFCSEAEGGGGKGHKLPVLAPLSLAQQMPIVGIFMYLCGCCAGVLAECVAPASAAAPLRPLRGGALLVRRGKGLQPRTTEQTVGQILAFYK